MTRSPHREPVTDQSPGRGAANDPYGRDQLSHASGSTTKLDAGVAVHNGVRSSAMSQGTPIVFVVDDDVSDARTARIADLRCGVATRDLQVRAGIPVS